MIFYEHDSSYSPPSKSFKPTGSDLGFFFGELRRSLTKGLFLHGVFHCQTVQDSRKDGIEKKSDAFDSYFRRSHRLMVSDQK
jgi:hypothetical protein